MNRYACPSGCGPLEEIETQMRRARLRCPDCAWECAPRTAAECLDSEVPPGPPTPKVQPVTAAKPKAKAASASPSTRGEAAPAGPAGVLGSGGLAAIAWPEGSA